MATPHKCLSTGQVQSTPRLTRRGASGAVLILALWASAMIMASALTGCTIKFVAQETHYPGADSPFSGAVEAPAGRAASDQGEPRQPPATEDELLDDVVEDLLNEPHE